MFNTVWAVVHEGKIELLERLDLPEGSRVLVTLPAGEDSSFWIQASHMSLATVWDNPEDEIYAQLLKE